MSLCLKRWILWLGLAGLLLQPTPHRISTSVAGDLGDSMFLTWTLSWGAHGLATQPLRVFDANIYHPHANTLALSDSMLSFAPIFGVLKWLTGDAIVAINILVIGMFVLALVCSHALGKWLFGREDLAILFAVVVCCNSYVFGQQNHPQLQTFGLISLCLLLLFRAIERRRRRDGVALAAVTVVLALANVLYGLIWVVAAVAVVVTLAARRVLPPIRSLVPVGLTAGVCTGMVLGPVALLYRRVLDTHGVKRGYEQSNSLGLRDLITPQRDNWSWGSSLDAFNSFGRPGEHPYFVGFTALLLGLVGVAVIVLLGRKDPCRDDVRIRIDEIVALVVAGLVALMLAVGPTPNGWSGPFRLFHAYVPGFDGVRVTARFTVVTFIAGAALVALAVWWLQQRLQSRLRPALVPMIVLLILIEVGGPMGRVVVPEGDHRLVYEALAEMDEGVVLELPIRTENDGAVWPFVEAMRMYHATIDFNPRINGYSGSAPRGFDALGDILNGYPSKEAGESIDGLGVRYVILHTGTEQGIQAYTVAEAEAIAAVAADLGGTISRHGNDWLVDRGENV
ncbi:MAG: hypothetical protein HOM37_03485 [Acidimicrobiaceae bacterium]|jgi:hypothetical protein|nr:hypothetical protein [Acidimicrobiaceae bacterium]